MARGEQGEKFATESGVGQQTRIAHEIDGTG